MQQEISFIDETISILSKPKSPNSPYQEDLSRIIHSQAPLKQHMNQLSYQFTTNNQYNQQYLNVNKQVRRQKKHQRVRRQNQIEQKTIYGYGQDSSKNNQNDSHKQKYSVSSKKSQLRSHHKKRYETEATGERQIYSNHKNRKRGSKLNKQQQKIDQQPYKLLQVKIKHQNYNNLLRVPSNSQRNKQVQIQVSSKISNRSNKQPTSLQNMHLSLVNTYKQLMDQVRELIGINRWQGIQNQKIQIRKNITRLQTEIRRNKIGFRGLNQNSSRGENSSFFSPSSKFKQELSGSSNNLTLVSRLGRQKKKSSKVIDYTQYGLEKAKNMTSRFGGNQKTQQQLSSQYQAQKVKQKKNKQYIDKLDKKIQELQNNRRGSNQAALKQKKNTLKTQFLQRRQYLSKKIKARRNANKNLKQQIDLLDKQLQKYKQSSKISLHKSKSKHTSSSNKQIPGLKSIASIHSTTSIPGLKSISSAGSIKSTKIQSNQQTSQEYQIRSKIKIRSAHDFSIGLNSKILAMPMKRRLQCEKSMSLQAEMARLRQKYSGHLQPASKSNYHSQYYSN